MSYTPLHRFTSLKNFVQAGLQANNVARHCRQWHHGHHQPQKVPWEGQKQVPRQGQNSNSMIEFFVPTLPTFCTNCQDGSHFTQMGSHFAQNTTSSPCSLPSRYKPLLGICTNIKHPQLHPKTPLFLAWTWKLANWTTVWANWTPSGQNVWKVDKTFLEVGKKKFQFQSAVTPLPRHDDTLLCRADAPLTQQWRASHAAPTPRWHRDPSRPSHAPTKQLWGASHAA